jgi:ribosome biogenesis GTPase A
MDIQWYPHHMARAKDQLEDKLELIDLGLEVLDARIPVSSRNAELEEVLAQKEKLVVLNKKDLANPELTSKWLNFFSYQEVSAVAVNSLTGDGVNKILAYLEKLNKENKQKSANKDIKQQDLRLMVVGIPNVGKSQLINQLSKAGSAKTGNTPGVTRGQQWIKIRPGVQLLDTPGILWPKFEAEEVGIKLAACGAIKEGNFDNEVLAYNLVEILVDMAPDKIKERFKLDSITADTYQLIAEMGKKRGCLQSGGKVDRDRISKLIIQEFRTGKLGRITLEKPEDYR